MFDLFLTLALIVSSTLTVILLVFPSCSCGSEAKVSVQVLVLGDIGRSPRMQYHAMSIAQNGGRVDLIGYQESIPNPGVVYSPEINIVPLSPPPAILRSKAVPFVIGGPLKVLWQMWTLLYALGYCTKPSRWLLVQNPPSIPTLLIAMIICFLRNTHLIIDWHNYGWTILAGTRGPSHPLVKISKYYEATLGSWAPTASFTVTDAMAKQLREAPYDVKSPIFTLHDRPAAIFRPISSNVARRMFLERLPETVEEAGAIATQKTRLIVSSTSWTPDEDFNLLLGALCTYSSSLKDLTPILAIITGKGPQKQMYLDRITSLVEQSKLRNITIKTAWLSTEDYATLLACSDLGVCLHKSSSGVDLPMKVVDMFGAGLPVVGYGNYASWGELVREGVNGCGFTTSGDLATILERLFSDSEGKELAMLRKGAENEGSRRWDDEWNAVASRLLGLCD
ncbi:chitobiosyldiphosphodolichol beta-mannosyltransferase [Amylocarpus encephaloides]|uniref:Chitobiosyldiphosphodolichol beta-mannosyltransferase n=1 Tax=Amylocarpus encephaloides TaxID=45428 RepID=A0A9P8C9Z9_9HELO|nr:chitobiosyldiphosphodolichol beta-mannosyltransferase [Amylocarpus encephaloides]